VICPPGAAQDVTRYWLKYGSWNGPGSTIASHVNARNASGYNIYPMPPIIGYEIAINDGCPAGVSPTKKVIRSGICHDLLYWNPRTDRNRMVRRHPGCIATLERAPGRSVQKDIYLDV